MRGTTWIPERGPEASTPNTLDVSRTDTLLGQTLQWTIRSSGAGAWFRQWRADGSFGAWQRYDDPRIREMNLRFPASSHSGREEELWFGSYGSGLARLDSRGLRFWRAFGHCDGLRFEGRTELRVAPT